MRTVLLAGACVSILAAGPDGAAIYKQQCALCHDHSSETRAPAPAAMREMSPENVIKSLETGQMKQQGAALSGEQRAAVAEFLTAKSIGRAAADRAGICANANAAFTPDARNWNGWGVDCTKCRFQPAGRAMLAAAA